MGSENAMEAPKRFVKAAIYRHEHIDQGLLAGRLPRSLQGSPLFLGRCARWRNRAGFLANALHLLRAAAHRAPGLMNARRPRIFLPVDRIIRASDRIGAVTRQEVDARIL